jgi:hypothetical protein
MTLKRPLRIFHTCPSNTTLRTQAAASEWLECPCSSTAALEVLTRITLKAVAACAFAVLIPTSLTHATAIASIGSGTNHKAHKVALLIRGRAFFVAAVSAVPFVIVFVASTDPRVFVTCALPTAFQSGVIACSHTMHFPLFIDGLWAAFALTFVLWPVIVMIVAVDTHSSGSVTGAFVHAASWLACWITHIPKARASAQLTDIPIEAILTRTELLVFVDTAFVIFATCDPSATSLL